MSTILEDVQGWGADIEKLLGSSGKSAESTTSVSVGADPLPELTAGLNALAAVAKLFTSWDADMNTPEMKQSSVAEKLQAFRDRVNLDLVNGDEEDIEKLESAP